MAHGTAVHVAAQKLYLEGASYEEVRERLAREGMKVNIKALKGWGKRENWEAARHGAMSAAQEKNEEKAVDRWARVLKQTERIRERVVQQLENAGAPKTLEGGIAAYVQVTRMLREYMPAQSVGGDAQVMFDRILDVFLKHPKVSLVVDKYRKELMEELGKVLKKGSGDEGGS